MAKPMYPIMTDVGKVTLYEGTILSNTGRFFAYKNKLSP